MSTTIRSIAALLLRDAGTTSLAPTQGADNANIRGASPGLLNAVAQSLNGAYHELWHLSPASMFERRTAAVLNPPTAITLTVTNGSTACTVTANGASWMAGCTLVINGDPYDNEFLQDTTLLLRPYMGTTGSHSATVYGDAVKLPANEMTVLNPVAIRGLRTLSPSSWTEFQTAGGNLRTIIGEPLWVYDAMNKRTGQPYLYFVDTRYDQSTTPATRNTFLRVAPMPSAAYPLDYRLLATPPQITALDIDTGDHLADPGTGPVVPWPELTLYAVARLHFSGDPLFTNQTAMPEILRQHKLAIDSLDHAVPQNASARATYADGAYCKAPNRYLYR